MYFQEIGPILSSVDEPMALCTVVATKGSTPRKAGARMIVTQSGTVYGTVGGGHFEQKVVVQALEVIQSGTPGMFRHELLQQHDMCCGGTMEVFIERMERKKKLYVFGAGHTGQALSRFAVEAGFDVWLVDDREAYLSRCSDPRIHCVLQNFEDALRSLKFDADAFVVVMTYRHDPCPLHAAATCLPGHARAPPEDPGNQKAISRCRHRNRARARCGGYAHGLGHWCRWSGGNSRQHFGKTHRCKK